MRAEDRLGWLDDEAAEGLLRGDAVDDTSPPRSADAEELAKALEGLAVSHQPQEHAKELPGEAAALAAFRASRSPQYRGAGLAPRTSRGSRMMRRTGIPLRAGLVMTFAGFALGGVAVAATNGMIPAPFGDERGPAPGASDVQSPAAEPLESEAGSDGNPVGPEPDMFSKGPSDSAESDAPMSPDTRDVAGADRGNDSDWGEDDTTDKPTTWPHDPPPDKGKGPSDPGSWPPHADPEGPKVPAPVVVALCRAYEGDRIAKGKRKQLERVAGGPERVLRYCERHGDGGGGGGTEGGDSGSGGIGIPETPESPGTPGTGDPSVPEDGEESSGGSGAGGAGGVGGWGGAAARGGSGGGGEGGTGGGADGGGDSAGATGAPDASNGASEGGAEPRISAESAV